MCPKERRGRHTTDSVTGTTTTFNSTLTIGGINPSFYEGDITYYSTADCVNCWNLTTDSLSLVTPTETTELVDAKTAPEVTIQFQTAYPYIALY